MSIQHLGQMTWNEVKGFVKESVVAILPLGSLEAHGPHLPLNTDVVIASEIGKRLARKLSTAGKDALICPPVVFTPALEGSRFSGTLNVAAGAYANYLRSILAEISGLGVRTAVLVSGHLDSAHRQAIGQCLQALESALGPEKLRTLCPDLTKEPWIHLMPAEFRAGLVHAGQYETSCMMAIHADHVREEVRKKLSKMEKAATSIQAYSGDPASATSAHGEDYLEALATIYFDAVTTGGGA